MAITTYNNAPYFDDYNIKDANGKTVGDKNYLKILFQPGQGVQTRELNQMQSILQAQIDRLGQSFYNDGQPVYFGEANYISNVIYIDITPSSNFNGTQLTTSLLLQPDVEVRPDSAGGFYAKVVAAETKSNESVRLYIEPISESVDSPNVPLENRIPNGTSLFFKDGKQITSASGGVINTQSNTEAFGEIAQSGYAFGGTVDEGIYYVKGHLVHTPRIQKYWIKSSKNEIVRGDINLIVNERIITSNEDATLLDNASGSYNYSAPGADRYQITLDIGFFEPVAYYANKTGQNAGIYLKDTPQTFDIKRLLGITEAGVDVDRNKDQSNLQATLAKRTRDESGNYVVKPFRMDVRELVDTTSAAGITNDPLYSVAEANNLKPFNIQSATEGAEKFVMQLSGSTAYVDGYRYFYPYKTTLIADKARTSARLVDVDTTLPVGNYIEVDLHDSPFGANGGADSPYSKTNATARFNIDHRFFAPQGVGTNSPHNNKPVIRAAQYVSDDSTSPSTYRWRFHLSEGVTMADLNRALPNMKAKVVSGVKSSGTYETGNNYITFGHRNSTNALGRFDQERVENLFRLPPGQGIQRVESVTYEYYKKFQGSYVKGSYSSGAARSIINLSGLASNETFVATSGTDKFDYTIIRREGSASPYNYRLINPENFAIAGGSSSSIQLGAVEGQASPLFNFSPSADNGAGNTDNDAQYIVYCPVKKTVGVDGSRQKVYKDGATDISGQLTGGGISGSQNQIITLGDQDVDTATIANNELGTSFEVIDDGLNNPEFYGKVKIRLTQDITFVKDGNDEVLLTYKFYEHKSGGDFFTANSYGDYTVNSPGATSYEEVPRFRNQRLVEYIDFRTKIDKNSPRTGSEYGPVPLIPNRNCTVTLRHYLPRKDRIIVDNQGVIRVIQGVPDLNPAVPELPEQSMSLYTTFVPAYTAGAEDIKVNYIDNSRFTMRDIGRLRDRIENIEYYSTISLLESDAFNKNILNVDGTDKFKNGMLVSNFKKDLISNPIAPGYLASINYQKGILGPFQRNMDFRLFYQYPQGAVGTNSYSPVTVEDYYINNTPNQYSFNTITNRSEVTSGRPQALSVKNFRIGSLNDTNTNGFYILYKTNTNGYPEYRLSTSTTSLDKATRRIVRTTGENPRWEIQKLNADNTYTIVYKTTAAGASGNDASYPTLVTAGGWSNSANQPQNTSTTGADASVINISQDVVETYLPESESASARDKTNLTGYNNPLNASLWQGMAVGREAFAQNLNASSTIGIQPYEVAVYKGKLKTSPDNDLWIDQVNRPARVVQNDAAMIAVQFVAEHTEAFGGVDGVVDGIWENNGPVGSVRTDVDGSTSGGIRTRVETFEDSVDQIRENTVFGEISSSLSVPMDLGERVVDINIVPHVRSRDISLYASGMKPNTRVYVFFDGKDVSRYVAATDKFIDYSTQESVNTYSNQSPPDSRNTGDAPFKSDELNHYDLPLFTTPETGEFFGTLRIPNNDQMRFRCGILEIKVTSSPLDNDDEADTFAEKMYQAFAVKADFEESIMATKVPEVETTRVTETRTFVTERTVTTSWAVDPVAETFFVNPRNYPHGISLTDVDLYFAEKPSYIADVEVYLTSTEGGLPTETILPGSRAHKPYHQVNVSANGRNETDGGVILQNATNFVFDFPVYLKPNKTYALVVKSKSIDYRLWTSEIGGSNLINAGLPITTQPFEGVLCKSANNRTWDTDQTRDLMFKLNKAKFDVNGTFIFHTKASGVYGTSGQQKIGEAQASAASNVKFSGIFLQCEDLVIPGTELKYSIDFQSSSGLLDHFTYGIPQSFDSTQTIMFSKEIDTVALGVSNVILTAVMSIPASMQKVDANGNVYADVSPIIDLDSINLLGIQNFVNPVASTKTLSAPFPSIQEARNSQKGFITKVVPLQIPANDLRLYLLTNRTSKDAGLEVYVKAKGISDTGEFNNFDWSPMEVRSLSGAEVKALGTASPSLRINPSKEVFTDAEYFYSPRPGNNISEYAIKIAFTGSDTSRIVRVKDFRAIATS
jgi:hypothetical protein